MLRFLAILFIACLSFIQSFSQENTQQKVLPELCLSQTEMILLKLINEYRVEQGLPTIKLSASLCYVARTHAVDQTAHHEYGSRCNLHSWSASSKWSSCCYTPDHKQAQCMWDKPRELTNYKGNGYEIAFYSTFKYDTPETFARDILNGWKHSPGHNDVILSRNVFKNAVWKAIGIGVHGEYADVWFGKDEDTEKMPKGCE